MLIIREAQLDALGNAPRIRFVAALRSHLERYFPDECEQGDLPRFIEDGIDRAERHGCETEREVALYLNLMVMLGCDFDQDPQIPWAGAGLDDLSIEGVSVRVSRVYDEALSYLKDIGGPDRSNLVRAEGRIRERRLTHAEFAGSEDVAAAIRGFLAETYPEKLARQGDEAMVALTNLAIDSARRRGATDRALAINALHMFMLGSGFSHDPLYPWARKILDGTDSGTVNARFDRLLAYLIAYMARTLQSS